MPGARRLQAAASVSILKFVNARGILRYELRNLRTTSNSMNLVRLLNLRFLNELAATNDRNLKFAALEHVPFISTQALRDEHGLYLRHGGTPSPQRGEGGGEGEPRYR